MREITIHQINECNSAIRIESERDAENGNASHEYMVTVEADPQRGRSRDNLLLKFQRGPIKEVGANGITNEVLLAIVADRLDGFQSGSYACEENADALLHVLAAMSRLHDRTKARVARGVEGTQEV